MDIVDHGLGGNDARREGRGLPGGEVVLACGCVSDAHGSGLVGRRLTQVRQITSACAAWRPAPVDEVDIFILDGVKIRLPVFWSVEPNGDLLVCEA